MDSLSTQGKWLIYVGLNLAFCLALSIAGSTVAVDSSQLPYVILLFAICTAPLPFVGRLNGAAAMLAAAMAAFFIEFGALDAMSILRPPTKGLTHSNDEGFGRTDLVLCLGALAQITGFYLAAQLTASKRRSRNSSYDWPRRMLLPTGILLWASGALAAMYHNLVVQPANTAEAIRRGLESLGVWRASGLILVENYAGPLGIIIVGYWWAVWGKRTGTALVLSLIAAQFVVGWIIDTKEVAISAAVIVLLTRFMVLGTLPTKWLVGGALGLALIFPILSAKRVVMTDEMRLTRVEALPRTFEILARTLEEAGAISAGKYENSSETFLQRESLKGNVDLIIKGTAQGHPYKMGATFEPLLYVFLPRVLWSDKPGGNSAVLLNREFHISEDPDTFISPSHLGEWYWNFGLAGVIGGMALSGALLGYVSMRFNLCEQVSLTRVLVVIVTLYLLVARSEGQIEIQYALWVRSMALIGLLHAMLARSSDVRRRTSADAGERAGDRSEVILSRFPNLLR